MCLTKTCLIILLWYSISFEKENFITIDSRRNEWSEDKEGQVPSFHSVKNENIEYIKNE